jgi:hypothetical protein
MLRNSIIVLNILCANLLLNAQGLREKKPLSLDELILEANYIAKSNTQYMRLDSLITEVDILKNKLEEKDSVILWLKKNNQIVYKNAEKGYEQGFFIIIGAFNIKSNAQALLKNQSRYPISIYKFQHSNLNYVGYKSNSNQNLVDALIYFRKYFQKDAWILRVSTN